MVPAKGIVGGDVSLSASKSFKRSAVLVVAGTSAFCYQFC